MTQPSVMIATPCYGGMLTYGFTSSLLNLQSYAIERGWRLSVELLAGDALITRARSTLVATFLQSDAEHMLFIDADITFKPEQVERLLQFDAEVVAALYPIKNIAWGKVMKRAEGGEPLHQAGLIYVAEHCVGNQLKTRGDFVTAEYAGTGFLLVRRSAFERMIAAYPETKFSAMHGGGNTTDRPLYALFECIIDPVTGTYLSEDYSFCRRWRKIGGEIWIDLKSKLTHTGFYAFEGDTGPRYAALLGPKP